MELLRAPRVYFIIAITSVVLYGNSIFCGFVFDDVSAIVNNKDVDSETQWSNLLWNDFWGTSMSEEGSHKSYRPLSVLSFKLNNLLHGKDPLLYHLVNVLLHASVSMLYFKSMQTICETAAKYSSDVKQAKNKQVIDFPDRSLARNTFLEYVPAIATALFVTHPIHCEAVTGVVGRAELLSALFMLLVFIFYSQLQVFPVCLSVIFLVCAAGCKEQGITIAAICAIYDMFVSARLTPVELLTFRKTSDAATGLRVCILAFVACLILLWRITLMNGDLPVFTFFDNPASLASTPSRQLTYNFLLVQNFWLLLNPYSLLCDWTFRTVPIVYGISDPRNLATLFLYFVLIFTLYHSVSRKGTTAKALLMGLSLLIFPFLPASNLFFPVGFVIAERVLYAPSMGYCLIVAIGVSKIISNFPTVKKPMLSFVVFVVLCFSVKTVHRNADWASDYTIFRSGLKVTIHNAKIWCNIGHALEEKDPQNALRHYKIATEVQPDDIGSQMNLGRLKKKLGMLEEAEASYRKANKLIMNLKKGDKKFARIAPEHLQVFVQLADLIKHNRSRLNEADELYREALSLRHDFVDAHVNRGEILILLGKLSEAIESYENALLYAKRKDDIFFNLAVVYSQIGNMTAAVEYYTYAIQENPDHVRALYNSAVIFEETGESDLIRRAKIRAERVLKLEPNNHLALSLMGSIHLDNGDEKTAASYWRKVLKMHRDDKSALYNMAHMYSLKEESLNSTLKYLGILLKYHPTYVKGLMLYGNVLLQQKKNRTAAGDAFKRIVAINPSHTQARHNYCVVILEEGKLREAEKCMVDVLAMDPGAKYVAKNLAIIRSHIEKDIAMYGDSSELYSAFEQDQHKMEESSINKGRQPDNDEDVVFVQPVQKKSFSKQAKSIVHEAKKAASKVKKSNPQTRLKSLENALRKVKSSVEELKTINKEISSDIDEKCPTQKSRERSETLEDLKDRALEVLKNLEAGLD